MPPRIARRAGPALLRPLLAAVAVLALVHPAQAWVEPHIGGDDVRLSIDKAGAARVEHRITLKISGGPLRALDIRGVDPDAQPELDSYVVPLKAAQASSLASATPVAIELLPLDAHPRDDGTPAPPTLRARFDGKGLSRGVFVLFFRYRTNLAARGLVRSDGPVTRIAWTGPLWDDGYDSARLIVELPAAPGEPRLDEPVAGDTDPAPPMTLSTLRRASDKDEIELLRPYAPKSEAMRWTVRADARAFRPEAAAPPPVADVVGGLEAAATPDPERTRTLYFAGGAALFALYSALVAAKGREHERLARAAGAVPRPLLPFPLGLRAAAAGLALVAGVALELLLKSGTAGAALVATATALAAHRTPRPVHAGHAGRALRRPGKWLPVSESEAFREPLRPRGVYLDVSTRAGKALLVAGLAALGAGVYVVAGTSPYHAHLLALDVTALLAIFCTGRLAELPPDPAARPAGFLRDIARRVRRGMKDPDLRIVGRLRIPHGSPDADELRLGLAPRSPLPGFVSIEVGVVYALGAGGAIGLPEILLRVQEGSPCDRAIARIARNGHSSARGRRPDERVLTFTPRLPNAQMTAAIAAALARAVATPPETAALKPKGSAAPRPPRARKKAVPAAA